MIICNEQGIKISRYSQRSKQNQCIKTLTEDGGTEGKGGPIVSAVAVAVGTGSMCAADEASYKRRSIVYDRGKGKEIGSRLTCPWRLGEAVSPDETSTGSAIVAGGVGADGGACM